MYKSIFIMALMATLSAGHLWADHHGAPQFSPVEIYACNYKDGKDVNDLNRATARWNKWMDESNADNLYAAYILTPVFKSAEIDFDFAWLGIWANGQAMGDGLASWMGGGGEIAAEFDKMSTCGQHALFAVGTVRDPGDMSAWQNFPSRFSDCTMAHGRSSSEGMKALMEWHKYQDEQGARGGAWIFFPGWGESSDASYDFKVVNAHPDWQELGADFDRYANGGGWQKAQSMLSGMDCDSSRVYHNRRVRDFPQAPE